MNLDIVQQVWKLVEFSRGRANSNKDGGSEDGKKRCLRGITYRNQNYMK